MRFYVPDWDDAVDAGYDFVNDEVSSVDKQSRDREFIWDIFGREATPVDGVLISREQVESNRSTSDLTELGVYEDPNLSIPEWLPTISDCGAWGYKTLPFPPYGNEEILSFYEQLDVSVGVTIDHLVLGNGNGNKRIYLDERAFSEVFKPSDIPATLGEDYDITVEEWPATWPDYVDNYAPSITDVGDVVPFEPADFEGDTQTVRKRLTDDPRAVVRDDDSNTRYELTLKNAERQFELYSNGDYSFRLMAAFQGWNPQSYAEAARRVLKMGYRYIGLGGAAGSSTNAVRDIVAEVGNELVAFERDRSTRVDFHVFGFAKPNAFDSIGRSGVASFDSASMLRAAWTGGNNYHLDADTKYDAIRVRFPPAGADLETAVESALRSQELHYALRAYGANQSISEALTDWAKDAEAALDGLGPYLKQHRHDDRYDERRIKPLTAAFRDSFAEADVLKGSFGEPFRRRLIKFLRDDDPADPLPFEQYKSMIDTGGRIFTAFPRHSDHIKQLESSSGRTATFDQIDCIVTDYARWIGDDELLHEYRRTLRERPWEYCNCAICSENGIEVAIFRGNTRNRRRGFHNTKQFYDQFQQALPKLLVVTSAPESTRPDDGTVETYLRRERQAFWGAVHDLPVIEIGAVTSSGVREWWESFDTETTYRGLADSLEEAGHRYQAIFAYSPPDKTAVESLGGPLPEETPFRTFESPADLRKAVLEHLGYDPEYVPSRTVQAGLGDFE